jgi:predicted nucleic acid-binding protein
MSFLFDTDAISVVLRPRPPRPYAAWLRTVDRADQYASAVTLGELLKGAHKSPARDRHIENIRTRVLPAVSFLPYDVAAAQVFGQIAAELERAGTPLADADLQIAATAICHDLELVTGNVKHFERVPGLRLNRVLADARA